MRCLLGIHEPVDSLDPVPSPAAVHVPIVNFLEDVVRVVEAVFATELRRRAVVCVRGNDNFIQVPVVALFGLVWEEHRIGAGDGAEESGGRIRAAACSEQWT